MNIRTVQQHFEMQVVARTATGRADHRASSGGGDPRASRLYQEAVAGVASPGFTRSRSSLDGLK
jgi:hypothetical protein